MRVVVEPFNFSRLHFHYLLPAAEASASSKDNGPLQIFDRFVIKVGEHSHTIDPWVCLVPDSYSLSVVKSAVAILLKVKGGP